MIQGWGLEWEPGTFIAWFLWGVMVIAAITMMRETRKRVDHIHQQQELQRRYGMNLSEDELHNLEMMEKALQPFNPQQVYEEWQFHSLVVSRGDYLSLRIVTGESFRGLFAAVVEESPGRGRNHYLNGHRKELEDDGQRRKFCCLLPYVVDHDQTSGRVAEKPLFIPLESIVVDSVFASHEH